ncbi:MAG TPA: isoprenylcysteine carboxylmethyltransferase family protein [Tepidisphaeraceae bacterium]|nr:isoprenylcysteine carboxylmethyltransferase family protein [Tepidisphaeraceae bacterium]
MRAVAIIVVFEAILAGLFVGCAGRWDLPWFWALLGIHTVGMVVSMWVMDPALKKERLTLGRRGGSDRSLRAMIMPFVLLHLVVAALDVGRFGWSGNVGLAVHVVGLVGYCAGLGLAVWAMAVNRFFAPVVRLQSERGHHVIDKGPYRFVRHPGYLGFLLALVAEAFMLGSYWSLLPVMGAVAVVLRRTWMEDRFLHESLAGYVKYAKGVKYRLAPAVW